MVVTGLGAVTPLGHDVPSFWRRLVGGERGIAPIDRFDPAGLRNQNGGQIRDWHFAPDDFALPASPDISTQFLLVSAREAMSDAELSVPSGSSRRFGAVLATNFGGAPSWEDYMAGLISGSPDPASFHDYAFGTSLDHLCSVFGLGGPSSLLSIACASGSAAIGLGLDAIRYGRADAMLCGGHDALAQSPLAGLSVLRTLTADDILPFSANRSGTMFGEGAGVVVLEELETALARDARIYCEVLGSWQNNNAYHLTAPDPGGNGMIRVVAEAIGDAGISPADIDYINAHGTGTQYHDPEETHAIKTVLGEHAYNIAVSSIKGAIGHLMGAAGAVEAVATIKAIQTGDLPPTINDGAADPEMDLEFLVNASQHRDISCAASISAGIGGHNSCVVFRAIPAGEGATA